MKIPDIRPAVLSRWEKFMTLLGATGPAGGSLLGSRSLPRISLPSMPIMPDYSVPSIRRPSMPRPDLGTMAIRGAVTGSLSAASINTALRTGATKDKYTDELKKALATLRTRFSTINASINSQVKGLLDRLNCATGPIS